MNLNPEAAPKTPAAILSHLVRRLESLSAEAIKFAESWRVWYASRPGPVYCPEHDAVRLTVDTEASIKKSWADRQNCLVFWPCPECQRAISDSAQNMILKRAGVPPDMLHCDLAGWKVRTAQDKETLLKVRQFAAKPCGALLLLGKDFGVGKTHLAVAVMREMVRRRYRSLAFVTYPRFVAELRSTYGTHNRADPVTRYGNVGFLVLDELGLSSGGRDELPALHLMLDNRKAKGLAFVLTSNAATGDALEPMLGARMMDRLREYAFDCRVLEGASFRKAKF